MVLHIFDDSILELILSKLPASALASAELVCSSWSTTIAQAQLWQRHTGGGNSGSQSSKPVSNSSRGVRRARPPTHPWREMCLHRAATAKWCSGRLTISATINGHSGPVTCIDVLDNTVITGSSDGTACVWNLANSTQQQQLQMPGKEAVVAVALPSISLAVTATAKGGAVLWRAGKAIRRFQVMPGGRVTSLALTDTQLLLGSTAGVVQYFDLFSGQQQLITRHGSGVTCLRTYRQQGQPSEEQQQQQQLGLGSEEWMTIVGCTDGQVSCVSSATGRLLWQLPTRHPSTVVSMHLVDHDPHIHSPCVQSEQQQQQQQQSERRQKKRKHGEESTEWGQRRQVLLYVLNARSQLICWKLPLAVLGVPSASAAADPAAGSKSSGRAGSSRAGSNLAGSSGQGSRSKSSRPGPTEKALKMPSWPMSVCSVAAPIQQQPSQTQPQDGAQQQEQGQQEDQQELQQDDSQQPARRQLLQVPHNSSTCMLVPEFGRDCVLVGSTLGYLTVVRLQLPGSTAAAAAADSTAATVAAAGAAGVNAAAAAVAADGGNLPVAVQAAAPAAAVAPVAAAPAALSASARRQQMANAKFAAAKELADNLRRVQNSWDIEVVRHCSLHKLGRMLAGRQAASIAAQMTCSLPTTSAATHVPLAAAAAVAETGPSSSSQSQLEGRGGSDAVVSQAQEHMLDGSKVLCMQWGPGGQVLVGLGSGHVCCLKFKHPAGSMWA